MIMLLLYILLTLVLGTQCQAYTREYYIAVVETTWNYLGSGEAADASSKQRPDVPKYTKVIYNEFTDSTFKIPKSKPPWAGLQGPIIRAQVNDKIVVHFKNFGPQYFSISPIGIPYWKQSEGAGYEDSTSNQEQGDDAVAPGGYYKYVWDVHIHSGPTHTDPDCLTYSYSSRVDIIRDFNSGLIGPLLICRAGVLTDDGRQKLPEFILFFAVFDENKSWYRNLERSMDKFKKPDKSREYHTINGHLNSSLPGLTMCQGMDDVYWHLVAVGTSPEIHTILFKEHSMQVLKHRKVSLEMSAWAFTTAVMRPLDLGNFQISCRIHSQGQVGMSANFSVEKCQLPVTPDKKHAKHEEEEGEDDYNIEDFISTVVLQRGDIASVLRASSKGRPKVWLHYVAAEERTWNYAPEVERGDSLSFSENLRQGPQRLGQEYKKVVFVEYTDKSFTKRKDRNPDMGLIGPVLAGEVGDKFQIVFKNQASRPYNIYPTGLTSISPLNRQVPRVDMSSLAIQPGESYTYLWKLTSEDGPTDDDPRCLTHLYQSTLNPERDLASGLVGPLIVCKRGSLDHAGRVVTSDKEKHLIFTVFDENKSWYIHENIYTYSENPSGIDPFDQDFYKSNIMNTVNGLVYSNLRFSICLDDVIFWHIANAGTQSDFLSVYFTGNPFEKDRVYETVLTLFPMCGETVATEMETLGEWQISAFDPYLRTQGMAASYTVVNCEKVLPLVDSEDDYNFDYDYDFSPMIRSARGNQRNQTVAIRVCRNLQSNNTHLDNSIPLVGTAPARAKKVCEVKYVTLEGKEDENVLQNGGIPDDILEELDNELNGNLAKQQRRRRRRSVPFIGMIDEVIDREEALGVGVSYAEQTTSPDHKDPEYIEAEEVEMTENMTEIVNQLHLKANKTLNNFFETILQHLGYDSSNSSTQRQNKTNGKLSYNVEDLVNVQNETQEEFGNSLENMVYAQNDRAELIKGMKVLVHSQNETQHLGSSLENSVYTQHNTTEKLTNTVEDVLHAKNNSKDELNDIGDSFAHTENDTQEEFGYSEENFIHTLNGTLTEVGNSMDNDSDRVNRSILHQQQPDNLLSVVEGLSLRELQIQNEILSTLAEDINLRNGSSQYSGDKDVDESSEVKGVIENLANSTDNVTEVRHIPFALEYDDYNDERNYSQSPNALPVEDVLRPRSKQPGSQSYYIAAEEIMWDYGVVKPHQLIKPKEMRRGYRKYFPAYKKVVFRAYSQKDFKDPIEQGQLDEHLGIMGPVLKAEVNDVLTVVFRNKASRPYSLHLHGVYDKFQGLTSPAGLPGLSMSPEEAPGEPVAPGEERVYNWRITKRQGPAPTDFDCKTGAYYSDVDMEKDIHSGLIGPLLICKPGTLLQQDVRDLFLLFTTFDERKSWYMEENIQKFCKPPCKANKNDPWFQISNTFSAINGYVAETLPGLALEQYNQTRWHLMNLGTGGEFHAVHFHGLPFSVRKNQEHRMGVFNLYPGVFATIQMMPQMLGTWMVECAIGEHQLSGMRAKLLVYSPKCIRPLGMQSGIVADEQITASDYYGKWVPGLARLQLSGSINAWMGTTDKSWLQVDLLKPMLIHGVMTQGARTNMGLTDTYTITYTLSYSLDKDHWRTYTGKNSKPVTFMGNWDGSSIKENRLSPPIIGRFIRLNPLISEGRPTLRLELLGCDLNSCLMPMGMQLPGASGSKIPDENITASSSLDKWLSSWKPHLARLHQAGRANAWRPKSNDPHQWIQVDFGVQRRLTAIITQGARALLKPMMVTEFNVFTSDDKHTWTPVTEAGVEKIFEGNMEHDEEKLNLFDPPLFARYVRVHPRGWVNDIALRMEFLGCETQQRL